MVEPVVLAEAVVGVAALHLDAERRDVADLDRVVLGGVDRLGEVLADLLVVDVEGGDELHVGDVVVAEGDVHEPRDGAAGVGVLVVLDTLDQGGGAVAHSHDGYSNRTHEGFLSWSFVPVGRAGGAGRPGVLGHGWAALLSVVSLAGLLVLLVLPLVGLVTGVPSGSAGHGRRVAGALGVDQLGEPAHLALDRLHAVPLELGRVAVDLLLGHGQLALHPVEPLLQPAAAALEHAQPDLHVGAAEEGEPDVEVVVLPGGGTHLRHQVLELRVTGVGELVDDLRPAGHRRRHRRDLLDERGAQHLLQGGVEGAVRRAPGPSPASGSAACAARSRAWVPRAAVRGLRARWSLRDVPRDLS